MTAFWTPGMQIQWIYQGRRHGVPNADRSVRRKDEDELAMALKVGRFDEERVREIEAYAAAAEQEISAWRAPFNEAWKHWRPDPAWPLPPAPGGYDIAYVAPELSKAQPQSQS